jgi:hypothetical protein
LVLSAQQKKPPGEGRPCAAGDKMKTAAVIGAAVGAVVVVKLFGLIGLAVYVGLLVAAERFVSRKRPG